MTESDSDDVRLPKSMLNDMYEALAAAAAADQEHEERRELLEKELEAVKVEAGKAANHDV